MLHRKIWQAYVFCNWDEMLHCCEASWEQPHHEILMYGGVLILSGEKDPQVDGKKWVKNITSQLWPSEVGVKEQDHHTPLAP